MPNKSAHARLRLTASRGSPPCRAIEHQSPDCGCQQAVHNTLQTAWIAISSPAHDMKGFGGTQQTIPVTGVSELRRLVVLTIRDWAPGRHRCL